MANMLNRKPRHQVKSTVKTKLNLDIEKRYKVRDFGGNGLHLVRSPTLCANRCRNVAG